MPSLQITASLLGRILLSAIFIISGYGKLMAVRSHPGAHGPGESADGEDPLRPDGHR